jgi:alpha-tubulin suppressor-like RCC1 family protein
MHSIALSNAGEVYGFGNNSEGQLGTNTNGGPTPTKVAGEAAVVDVSAGYSHSLALH